MFRRSWSLFAPTEVVTALKILGLSEGASSTEVRSSYLKLARAHHPDLEGGDDKKMKVINVAYETLQLQGTGSSVKGSDADKSTRTSNKNWYDGSDGQGSVNSSFKKRKQRMADLVDDEYDTWSTRTDNDWTAAVSDVSPEESLNPSNHPKSYSRFYSREDDLTIFRMLRSGATIPQVARAVSKPATFVGKRVHNAQFKLRIQELLRMEKSGVVDSSDPLAHGAAGATIRKQRSASETIENDFWDSGFTKKIHNGNTLDSSRILSKTGINYSNFVKYNQRRDRDPRRN